MTPNYFLVFCHTWSLVAGDERQDSGLRMSVEPLGIEMDLDAMFGHHLNVDVTLPKLTPLSLLFQHNSRGRLS